MVLKRCAFKSCKNDSSFANKEQMKGVVFIRFPSPELNIEKCERWVNACNRRSFTVEDVTDETYICSKHFVGGNGPTVSDPDPIPNIISSITSKQSFGKILRSSSKKQSDIGRPSTQLMQVTETCDSVSGGNNLTLPLVSKKITFFGVHEFDSDDKKLRNTIASEACSGDEYLILSHENCDQKKKVSSRAKVTSKKIKLNCSADSNSVLPSFQSVNKSIYGSCSKSSLIFNNKGIGNHSTPEISTTHIPLGVQSGSSCQFVLSKLHNSPISNELPILIKVLPNDSTDILPSAAVAVIPVKAKKAWMQSLNACEFCFKWASLGLSVEFSNGSWIFTSINGSLAEKQLKLSAYGDYEVKVLGNCLVPNHSFFDGVEAELNEERDFHCLMSQFSRWKLCAGNDVVDKLLDDTVISIRAFVCNLTQTLRSKCCELLVNGNGPIRCKECKMLLNRIRRLKYQKRKASDDKILTDTSENEQSQHSTSDHEIPLLVENGKQFLQSDNFSLTTTVDVDSNIATLNPGDRSDDDAIPADYLCIKMIEDIS